jgi:hypothetical protein
MAPLRGVEALVLAATALVLPFVVAGCQSYRTCAVPSPTAMAQLPTRLSETGLYADFEAKRPSPLARAYEPAIALWSDGATKKRWIQLPEDTHIDTRNLDDWSFPVGTRVWKEFALGGRPLETRYMLRYGPGERDWAAGSYVWSADGRDATLAVDGARDVLGTKYDAPPARTCAGCHAGRRSYVLGFSAVQLGNVGKDAQFSLAQATEAGWLSVAPSRSVTLQGTATERAALGYVHANCGNCHNQQHPTSDGTRCFDPRRTMQLWVNADDVQKPRDGALVTTSVPKFIVPGHPDDSRLLTVMARRGMWLHMPPLASKEVDRERVLPWSASGSRRCPKPKTRLAFHGRRERPKAKAGASPKGFPAVTLAERA